MEPRSLQGLRLIVPTCPRRVEVGEVQVFESSGPRPPRGDDELSNTGFVFFSDPDGNGWAVQIDARR